VRCERGIVEWNEEQRWMYRSGDMFRKEEEEKKKETKQTIDIVHNQSNMLTNKITLTIFKKYKIQLSLKK